MGILFGSIALSSVAASFGLATGQTYLIIVGFIGISVGILAYLYRKFTRSLDPSTEAT